MNRPLASFAAALTTALAFGLQPPPARAQATTVPPRPPSRLAPKSEAQPAEPRFRLVLDFAALPGSTSYGDVRTPIAYAEPSRIATSYDAATGLGGAAALQASLYRGLGLLVGYSHLSRDASGTLDVSRPHPLYLNRPRSATAELPGSTATRRALSTWTWPSRGPPGSSTGRSSAASRSSASRPSCSTCRRSTRSTRTTA